MIIDTLHGLTADERLLITEAIKTYGLGIPAAFNWFNWTCPRLLTDNTSERNRIPAIDHRDRLVPCESHPTLLSSTSFLSQSAAA